MTNTDGFYKPYSPDHIDGPRPGYKAVQQVADAFKDKARMQTPAEEIISQLKASLDKALADQAEALKGAAERDRAKLQRELEAKHALVKTVVTVERVSADGRTRRVEQQWEANGPIEQHYQLHRPGHYPYPLTMGATITLKLENPTDALARAKATKGR